jgi:acetyl esterase/lipase
LPIISINQSDLAEARRVNRKLSKGPRFRVRNPLVPIVIQTLLRLSQLGGDRLVRRAGLTVEQRHAGSGIDAVPVRILRPPGKVRGVVLDIHGGGWVIGNARMDDALNLALIKACDVAVVSVEYQLAGRTSIQGMMDDCLLAARWLFAGGMPEYRDLPIFVLGESAGAHLATATLLRLKEWPELLGRVAGAVLYYGVYDLAGTDSVKRAGPDTLVLDGPGMITGLRSLTPGMSDAERRQAPLSPLYGDLQGLPPALMFVGDLDPLLDDTVRMAARWSEIAEVELHRLPEAPHGFIRFKTGMATKALAGTHAWVLERLNAVGSSE